MLFDLELWIDKGNSEIRAMPNTREAKRNYYYYY